MYGRQRQEGNNSAVLGIIFIGFWWILNLFTLNLSRLREYYADRHSAAIVEDGPRKLSIGLAKIVQTTRNMGRNRKETKNLSAFKALFIADPDRAEADSSAISTMNVSSDQQLVQNMLTRRMTPADRIGEIFSTHPNIIKRLKALQELS
jgi:heat shock protein HtpX